MNLPFFIARKYFLSRKKKNFINILSIISMGGVAVGTMSLIIVLSVFNGLEDFIRNLYHSFDPELKIKPVAGKSFLADSLLLNRIRSIEGISEVIEVIEDNAYVKYRDAEMVITLKGVSDNFIRDNPMIDHIVEGNFKIRDGKTNLALLGRGIQYTLNIHSLDEPYPLQVFYPNRKVRNISNPLNAVIQSNIRTGGVFAIEKQYDINYVIVPLTFAEQALDYAGRRTSIDIKVKNPNDIPALKNKLQELYGNNFKILDSDEQHASLVRAVKFEKIFVFITFLLIISVAAINIFFSLTMLVIDKRKDISILMAMGAGDRFIRKIFFNEGAIIGCTGVIIGILSGALICYLQMKFGLVSLGIETSVISAYPVKMVMSDFVLVAISILSITILFVIRPSRMASRTEMTQFI